MTLDDFDLFGDFDCFKEEKTSSELPIVFEANKYEKIEDVKRPIKIGEIFIVPCLVKREGNKVIFFAPVYHHKHDDRENYQEEYHYHTDYRFVQLIDWEVTLDAYPRHHPMGFEVEDSRYGYRWVNENEGRLEEGKHGNLEYHALPVVNKKHFAITTLGFLKNSKFKDNCIRKGKCPHRGYDLSQELPDKNGIITCPMHGLRFDAKTKCILEEDLKSIEEHRLINNCRMKEMKKANRIIFSLNGKIISNKKYNEIQKLNLVCYMTHEKLTEKGITEVKYIKRKTEKHLEKELPIEQQLIIEFKVIK